jgi:hypothetical protein
MFAQQESSLRRPKLPHVPGPASSDAAVGLAQREVSKPLNFFQQCVLILIELDPSLTYDRQRPRLRELAKLFHPLLTHDKVGRCLAKLRSLSQDGSLITEAFAPRSNAPPDLQHAIQVINELGQRCGWAEKSSKDLQVQRVRTLRLLGHVVSPLIRLSGDEPNL